jgi:hypothetical protein
MTHLALGRYPNEYGKENWLSICSVIDTMSLMIQEEWELPDGIITVLPDPWTKKSIIVFDVQVKLELSNTPRPVILVRYCTVVVYCLLRMHLDNEIPLTANASDNYPYLI